MATTDAPRHFITLTQNPTHPHPPQHQPGSQSTPHPHPSLYSHPQLAPTTLSPHAVSTSEISNGLSIPIAQRVLPPQQQVLHTQPASQSLPPVPPHQAPRFQTAPPAAGVVPNLTPGPTPGAALGLVGVPAATLGGTAPGVSAAYRSVKGPSVNAPAQLPPQHQPQGQQLSSESTPGWPSNSHQQLALPPQQFQQLQLQHPPTLHQQPYQPHTLFATHQPATLQRQPQNQLQPQEHSVSGSMTHDTLHSNAHHGSTDGVNGSTTNMSTSNGTTFLLSQGAPISTSATVSSSTQTTGQSQTQAHNSAQHPSQTTRDYSSTGSGGANLNVGTGHLAIQSYDTSEYTPDSSSSRSSQCSSPRDSVPLSQGTSLSSSPRTELEVDFTSMRGTYSKDDQMTAQTPQPIDAKTKPAYAQQSSYSQKESHRMTEKPQSRTKSVLESTEESLSTIGLTVSASASFVATVAAATVAPQLLAATTGVCASPLSSPGILPSQAAALIPTTIATSDGSLPATLHTTSIVPTLHDAKLGPALGLTHSDALVTTTSDKFASRKALSDPHRLTVRTQGCFTQPTESGALSPSFIVLPTPNALVEQHQQHVQHQLLLLQQQQQQMLQWQRYLDADRKSRAVTQTDSSASTRSNNGSNNSNSTTSNSTTSNTDSNHTTSNSNNSSATTPSEAATTTSLPGGAWEKLTCVSCSKPFIYDPLGADEMNAGASTYEEPHHPRHRDYLLATTIITCDKCQSCFHILCLGLSSEQVDRVVAACAQGKQYITCQRCQPPSVKSQELAPQRISSTSETSQDNLRSVTDTSPIPGAAAAKAPTATSSYSKKGGCEATTILRSLTNNNQSEGFSLSHVPSSAAVAAASADLGHGLGLGLGLVPALATTDGDGQSTSTVHSGLSGAAAASAAAASTGMYQVKPVWDRALAEAVVQVMRERGLSQTEVVNLCGLSGGQAAMSAWVNGKPVGKLHERQVRLRHWLIELGITPPSPPPQPQLPHGYMGPAYVGMVPNESATSSGSSLGLAAAGQYASQSSNDGAEPPQDEQSNDNQTPASEEIGEPKRARTANEANLRDHAEVGHMHTQPQEPNSGAQAESTSGTAAMGQPPMITRQSSLKRRRISGLSE